MSPLTRRRFLTGSAAAVSIVGVEPELIVSISIPAERSASAAAPSVRISSAPAAAEPSTR